MTETTETKRPVRRLLSRMWPRRSSSQDVASPIAEVAAVESEDPKRLLLQEAQNSLDQRLMTPFESVAQSFFAVAPSQAKDLLRQMLRDLIREGKFSRSISEEWGLKGDYIKFMGEMSRYLESVQNRPDFLSEIFQTGWMDIRGNQTRYEDISGRGFVMERRVTTEEVASLARHHIPTLVGDRVEVLLSGWDGPKVNTESRTRPARRDVITEGLTVRRTSIANLYHVNQLSFRGYAVATPADATHGNLDVVSKEVHISQHFRSVGP